MRILVACEFSGIVRDAFIAKGHAAMSCDLLPTERPGPHFQGSVDRVLYDGWDMLIGFPPCTYLTNAGVRWLHEHDVSRRGNKPEMSGPKRWEAMYRGADFFLMLKNAPIKRIALENPIPHQYARDIIGDYTQIIRPNEHGANESKSICLWLKNLPEIEETNVVPIYAHRVHEEPPGEDRWLRRSRMFPGVAQAFADQWG